VLQEIEASVATMHQLLHEYASELKLPAGLHLAPTEVAALEELLGVSMPLTPSSLRTAIERLASVRIGDIRIPFTPGQLAELQHRAAKRGRTVEAEIRAVVARIEDELFYQGG
jgi:hypothetical protein